MAIIGGGAYAGAPSIAGMGAYRAGVDLVHIFVPENNYDQVSSFAPELIIHKFEGEFIDASLIEKSSSPNTSKPGMVFPHIVLFIRLSALL